MASLLDSIHETPDPHRESMEQFWHRMHTRIYCDQVLKILDSMGYTDAAHDEAFDKAMEEAIGDRSWKKK